MDPKSAVVKSKSSNSGISKKSKEDRKSQTNKKTWSNADFPPGPKKRGVYVERRAAKLYSANENHIDAVTQKPPTRPRAGQKKFLASVLTILSKSTTGTQFPERNESTTETFKKKTLKRFNKEEVGSNVTRNANKKYKSRVLNKKFVKEDKKKMVVLQSRRDIAQTPSNYSDWSYKDVSQKSNTSNYLNFDDSNNIGDLNVADELKNALLEGRNMKKMKKLRYQEEPKTLVSDEPKIQKNLYNFFVDLLETTISVYNVNTEYDNAPNDSETVLQINESVATKLNIDKEMSPHDEVIVNQQIIDVENESDYEDVSVDKPITIKPSRFHLKTGKHKKLKADSFIHANKKCLLPKSKSLEMNKNTMYKNKNDLINVLKRQLEVETQVFEEPQSIFQALKVMARNKKRITFDPSIDLNTFTDECILKRRKVISSRIPKKNKNRNNVINTNNMFRPKTSFIKPDKNDNIKKVKPVTDNWKKNNSNIDNKDSYHSLEVYGYDYESKQPQIYLNKPKNVTFMYHSSPTTSDLDFDVTDAILNPLSEFSIKKISGI